MFYLRNLWKKYSVVKGCERTGSDNASDKIVARMKLKRTHEIIKINKNSKFCLLKNFVACRTRPVGTLPAISINFMKR